MTGTGGTIGLYAESAHLFERQLINDGYLIIKCFFHVSKQAQKERIDKLCEDESTSWRVTDSDIRQNKHYDEYYPIIDTLLERTNAADSMWHLIRRQPARPQDRLHAGDCRRDARGARAQAPTR